MKKIIVMTVIFLLTAGQSITAKDVSLIKLANLLISNADLQTRSGDDYMYYRDLTNDNRTVYLKLQIGTWEERFEQKVDHVLEVKLSSDLINMTIDWRIIRFLNGKLVILTKTDDEITARDATELRYIREWFNLFNI